MSQENVEIVRQAIRAWNRRDATELEALWHPDAEVDWSRSIGPLKGVYRGRGARATFADAFFSTFDDVQTEAHDFIDRRRRPQHRPHPRTRRDRGGRKEHVRVHGRERTDHTLRMFQERAEALEAAGLSE
jgi:hypothetical protein